MTRVIVTFLAVALAACGSDEPEPFRCMDAELRPGNPHLLTITTAGEVNADRWQVRFDNIDEIWVGARGNDVVTVDAPACAYVPERLDAYRGDELVASCDIEVHVVTADGQPGVCFLNRILPDPN